MTAYSQQQLSLNLQGFDIPLTPGTKINANEISTLRSQSGDGVVAEVIASSPDSGRVTLRNRSYQAWTMFRGDGSQSVVLPSQSIEVTAGIRINFVSVQGEVRVSQVPVSNGYVSPPPVPPEHTREPVYYPDPTPVNSGGNPYNSGNPGYNPVPVYQNYSPPVYQPPNSYPYPYSYPRYAGFWLRFIAVIIDGIILTIVYWLVVVIVVMILGGENMSESATTFLGLFAIVFSIGLYWLYFAGMESSAKQATLGKMALGLQVTDLNYNRVSFGKATARHFGKIVSGFILCIGYIMAGFTEKKQALHDMMAGCLVLAKK